jgi:hypothetical protein
METSVMYLYWLRTQIEQILRKVEGENKDDDEDDDDGEDAKSLTRRFE